MVINSAGFQNAGKEFMLFSGASAKSDAQQNTDTFSAIFNNVTGKNTSLYSTLGAKTDTGASTGVKTDTNTFEDAVSVTTSDVSLKETKSTDTLDTDTADTVAESEEAASEDTDVDSEDVEKAATLLLQVTVTITEVLNVSMDELEQGMQDLGLDAADLLQADNRYSLFVNLEASGDPINLLKDNALVDLFNTMENQLSDLFTTEGITESSFAATLTSCLDAVLEKVNSLMETSQGISSDTKDLKSQNLAKTEVNGDQTVIIDGVENTDSKDAIKTQMSQNDSTDNNSTDTPKKEKETEVKAETVSDKFVNHMVNTFEEKFTELKATDVQYTTDLREIVNQIMDQVKVHLNSDSTSLEIQLTPESLGKVQVSVEDNNGVMTAKFQAETRVAKEAIESNLIQFKENLAEQGIKVDSVEVSVGNFDFTGNNFSKNHDQEAESHVKRHFTMDDAGAQGTQTVDLKEAAYIESGTSTVSFTA